MAGYWGRSSASGWSKAVSTLALETVPSLASAACRFADWRNCLDGRISAGRDLAHLKRKTINIKVTGYYLELEAVEELRTAGLKGYGFSLIDGFDLVDRRHHCIEQTIFRVLFSDPYSRQLLARRVVSRPKAMLKMRSELAFLLRLYLEPILMGRGVGREHSIELLNLIRVLNLPTAGWHRFKSRRKAIFMKAIQELSGMNTADGCEMDVGIQQGLNHLDFVLVAGLMLNEKQQSSIAK